MILTCPDCGTQYVVKDDAIPPEGRQVRCAACKHSWHQDPEVSETSGIAPVGEIGPAADDQAPPADESGSPPADEENLAEATLIDPRSGPEAEQRAYEEAVIEGDADAPTGEQASEVPETESRETSAAPDQAIASDWDAPPEAEPVSDDFSPFAAEDELEPRRRSPARTILLLVLLVIVAAAAFWFFAPATLKAKLGIATAGATPLQIVTTHMDRQHLESGNDLLTLTGRVINPSGKEQSVPPLQVALKNHSGQVVYSWTIQPPAPSLAAGASAPFNSAEVSVPSGGEELTITLEGNGRNS